MLWIAFSLQIMKSCQVAINVKGCISVLHVPFEPTVTAKDKANKFSYKQVYWQNHGHLTAVLMDAILLLIFSFLFKMYIQLSLY